MESENVEISRKELETLLARDYLLELLECAGVDNWGGWDEAREDYWPWIESEEHKKAANNYRPT